MISPEFLKRARWAGLGLLVLAGCTQLAEIASPYMNIGRGVTAIAFLTLLLGGGYLLYSATRH